MKTLILNEWESIQLRKHGAVEITRNGFDILIEKDEDFKGGDYIITVVNPYDKVLVKEPRDRKNWHI